MNYKKNHNRKIMKGRGYKKHINKRKNNGLIDLLNRKIVKKYKKNKIKIKK